MRVYKDKERLDGPVITIGSFDGIHIGHQFLIKAAISEAKSSKTRAGIVSFDPIPIQFFNSNFPFLLTTTDEKEKVIENLDIDFIYYFTFNKTTAGTTPDSFLRLIKDQLKPSLIITGTSHRFGRGRKGNVAMIKKFFDKVLVLDPITIDGNICSSTWVRESLVVGKVTTAWRLLGRPYRISGIIGSGTKQGREIGFPTINLTKIDGQKIIPAEGVYLIRCLLANRIYHGAMSIGEAASIKSGHTIEAHLFNFSKEAYGESVTIDFLFRLRDMKHFKSREALKKQIKTDIALAKEILKNL